MEDHQKFFDSLYQNLLNESSLNSKKINNVFYAKSSTMIIFTGWDGGVNLMIEIETPTWFVIITQI